MRRLVLIASAFLAGASGLGLEVLLLSTAGLALGYGRSTAIGLALFIAGWALGAFLGGRSRASPTRSLFVLGATLAIAGWAAVRAMLWLGGFGARGAPAEIAAALLIALVALLQGAFLPLFARIVEAIDRREHDASALLAASFAGSVIGAYAIGDRAVAHLGRIDAAAIAGTLALGAALLALCAARGERSPQDRSESTDGERIRPDHVRHDRLRHDRSATSVGERERLEPTREAPAGEARIHREISFARAAWIVGWCTAWLAGLEWIGLRLGVLWLSGMQPALTAVVCASLIALALGAAVVPRCLRATPQAVTVVLIACCIGAAWPVHAARALQFLGEIASSAHASDSDPRAWQTELERMPEIVRALVLVGPSLFAFGATVPILHRVLARSCGASGERLGRLFLHETWGALVGIPLVHLVLVPELGLARATAALMLIGALALAAMLATTPRSAIAGLACVALLAITSAACGDPALDSPPLANPAFTIRSFRHDRDFAVAVVDDGRAGERTLLTDGFRAAGTGAEYRYMSVLGHLPILLHDRPRHAAVLALGTGTTLGAVALHPEVERIDVLEISDAVVAAAPWFETKNHGVLNRASPTSASDVADQGRVRVCLGDGRHTLAQHPREYDVITMEPLLPDSPFAVYLYTREFYSLARGALAPGGLVCQWVPPHALEPKSFRAVVRAFESSFEWSSVWLFGTQVILLGGEREPVLDARRFATLDANARAALHDLGIDSPRGVLARFTRANADAPAASLDEERGSRAAESSATEARPSTSERALTDADPWIAYRPRRSGAVLLSDLPENLRWLRGRAVDAPPSWLDAAGSDAALFARGVRALHDAREAHARDEAALRGAAIASETGDPDLASALAEARRLCPSDPELGDFERELEFLGALRRGISALAGDRSRAGAESALPDLVRATELERERADVHLYMAAALSRLSSPAAPKALDAALTRCPRAADTLEGRRAHALGIADDLWRRAELSAKDAARGGG